MDESVTIQRNLNATEIRKNVYVREPQARDDHAAFAMKESSYDGVRLSLEDLIPR